MEHFWKRTKYHLVNVLASDPTLQQARTGSLPRVVKRQNAVTLTLLRGCCRRYSVLKSWLCGSKATSIAP